MAPSPKSIGVKYGEVMRSPRKFGIQENLARFCQITGEAVYASPASSAPPGRRIPNVTATASQIRPRNGGMLVAVIENAVSPYIAPPNPAMPADSANSATCALAGDTPEVRAATCELRAAYMARPDGDFCRLWISKVTTPKTMSSMHTICDDFEKSNLWIPNGLNVGKRKL